MSGMILIHEDDASHAKACAEYLAKLATKLTKISEADGDAEDVENNLSVILSVLEGKGVK